VTRDERQWLRPPSARTIGTSGVIPVRGGAGWETKSSWD
jgi:hypothetical protein